MTAEQFVKGQIAGFAHAEASHAGGDAMLAVACIIRNRVKAGWQGGDWLRVLQHAGEFSAIEPLTAPVVDLSSAPFRMLLGAVEDVFAGSFQDTLTGGGERPDGKTGGALYFMDSTFEARGGRPRPWFYDKILQQPAAHPRVAQVGTLYLYR